MKRSFFVKLLSLMLAIAFPAAAFAADTRAMLMPQGAVNVNGNAAARSSVVFNGDRITTGDNSTGTITIAGSTIGIAPKSSAVYSNGNLEVAAGGASVVTNSGVSGKLDNLTVVPVNNRARYDFVRRGDTVMIAALEGKLRISDGRQQMVLEAGNAISIADTASPDSDSHSILDVSNAKAVAIAAVVIAAGVGLSFGLIKAFAPQTASPTR
jgi:hypothetical protein